MSQSLARRAGDALTWRAVQVGGTKGLFVIRTLVLARLLSPDDFGLFAIATVALGVLMSTTDLGMVPALVHRVDAQKVHYDGAWTVGVVRGLVIATVLFLAAPAVAALFAEPQAAPLLRILALKPLIDATGSIRIASLTRDLKYRRLALVSVGGVAVETVVSIALAQGFEAWALVYGALAGGVAGVLLSYAAAPYRPAIVLSGRAIGPLIGYGQWIFLIGIVSVAAGSLTQVVISRQLGAFELGLYFLATKLALLPYEIGSQVVGEVAFPLFARIQDDRARVARAFRATFVGMSAALLPLYVLLIPLAPWVVQDVLGPHWSGTESLIQTLALVGIAGLFGDACGPLFRGLGHPRWVLAIEVVQSGLVLALLWTLTARYGAIGAAMSWVIAVAATQLLNAALVRRLIRRPFDGAGLPLAAVLVAALMGAVSILIMRHVASGVAGLIAAAVIATAITAGLVLLLDRRLKLGVGDVLIQTFPQAAALMGVAPAR